MTNQPGFNCKQGSAWRTWQTAGADWRSQNPFASREQAELAALDFGEIGDYPDIGKDAKRRAFLECAGEPITDRPGDMAAAMAEETGIEYSRCLVMCNMD